MAKSIEHMHLNSNARQTSALYIMQEGKRVLNALYTLCNNSSGSNVTSHLEHMIKLRSQTLYFSPDYEKHAKLFF